MGVDGISYYVGIMLGIMLIMKWGLKSVNIWIYERNLGKKRECLPPGDFGWPFVGNMWSFLRAFKSNDPDSFIFSLVQRFGPKGIYKSFMFGNPSIIITTPEECRRVLCDEDAFKPGWPTSTNELMGRKSFSRLSNKDHKRLRKLTASPINGHESLSIYMKHIETNVVLSLEKWSKMGRIELLTVLRKLTFEVIMDIFISSESEHLMDGLEKEYKTLNYGVRSMAINIPGFVYYEALKARKKLVAILQPIVRERRNKREATQGMSTKDMLDALVDTEDENGKRLDDEDIIDTLIMYLNAGHESSAHLTMWATILLQGHPEYFQIAKEEQERIVKNMPPGQKGLTLEEFRQMKYLSQVIDETLRLVTFSTTTFREATKDIDIKGYIIPKGWKVLLWYRSIHHNPEIYPQPKEFNPSRWDDLVPKAGTFLPFGAGTRHCPGNDLAKLEIAIFLHHFLLSYK
uniref:ent-kaurenoic acid oxidase 1-like n=1 Tax=Erigeron canadensis TaxID=72917 RepID=UPI001CB88CA1|nr:ent-kaurenoic acid oxidase 1-like [Erigeron canadensis]